MSDKKTKCMLATLPRLDLKKNTAEFLYYRGIDSIIQKVLGNTSISHVTKSIGLLSIQYIKFRISQGSI